MTVHIRAIRGNGDLILGNLDGQAVIRAKNYRRTKHYRSLKSGQFKAMPYVFGWTIETENGMQLERIKHSGWNGVS